MGSQFTLQPTDMFLRQNLKTKSPHEGDVMKNMNRNGHVFFRNFVADKLAPVTLFILLPIDTILSCQGLEPVSPN